MAEKTNAEDRRHLSVDTPNQIPKESQGSESPIPLSPQWLLPKPGENKPGIITGEQNHQSPYTSYTTRSDTLKSSGNGDEFQDAEKKRDVFRLPLHDAETGRHDRWRDEERDTNSTIRRDRWREGEKEIGDTRKVDRWTDSSSIKHSGEARRVPSERWADPSNRESNYDQRRESKWNSRWGPDDKELENRREKWLESSRDSEGPRDKGFPPAINHGRDTDKEADHYPRPWRSNSFQNRGRGEYSHHQNQSANRHTPMFGYGRGRGESSASTFSAARGRFSSSGNALSSISSHPHSMETISDKSVHGDLATLKYSRTKLLDIYRMADVRTYKKHLDGFIEVASLTQAEPSDPLALSAPTSEELVILKGIDKGDIVSSGAPQVSKEGSVGRNSTEASQLRRTKLGSTEDLPSTLDDYKDGNIATDNTKGDHFTYSESLSHEKYMHPCGLDSKVETVQPYPANKFNVEALRMEGTPPKKADEAMDKEVRPRPDISLRSQSVGDRVHGSSHDWRDFPPEVRPRASDMVGWTNSEKDQDMDWEKSAPVSSSHYKDQPNWQGRGGLHSEAGWDSNLRRQPSEVLERESEPSVILGRDDAFIFKDKKFQPQPSPEDLSLYYKDPHGEIQGPFSGSDLIGWFEAGYFGIDLQVRLATASADAPFSLLGDVMPHLRMKARPPPGFGAPKQSDILDVSTNAKFSSLGKPHIGLNELEQLENEQRNRHKSATEVENRFLESLMNGNMSSSLLGATASTEGIHGYIGNSSGGFSSVGMESGNDRTHLLAQRMAQERQRSEPNPLLYWPVRDAASMVSKSEIVPESPIPNSKLPPTISDTSHQLSQSPQKAELLSLLQGMMEKSSSAINNGISGWSNYPDVKSLSNTNQGGIDIRQDNIDVHHNQHFASQTGYGVQPKRMQTPHQPSLSHISHHVDHSSGIISPEKLLSSGISQDPQTLSILQQQYLLSQQLQLHPNVPDPTQLSLLDKFILLQRHKQEQQQQQQQQLLLQQQQHLLSQILSGHQSQQHFGEPSYGQLQTNDSFQINSQMPVLTLQDGQTTKFGNLPRQGSQDVSSVGSEIPSVRLPHQIFENTVRQEVWGATLPQKTDDIKHGIALTTPAMADSSSSSSKNNETIAVVTSEAMKSFVPSEEGPGIPFSVSCTGTGKNGIFVPEEISDIKFSSRGVVDESQVQREQFVAESPMVREEKNVEMHEVKKISEKKSRKQKNSKAHSSPDQVKGVAKAVPCQQLNQEFEIEGTNVGEIKSETRVEAGETLYESSFSGTKSGVSTVEPVSSLQILHLSGSVFNSEVETGACNTESRESEFISLHNMQTSSVNRAWKPASGLKAKSLLEIQQEEQRRAHAERLISEIAVPINPVNSSLPTAWAGVVTNSEPKTSSSAHIVVSSENTLNPKSKKSQLHNLLVEEVLEKSNERVVEDPPCADKDSFLPPLPLSNACADVSNDDFVEAKDTKKSRKKAAKGKGAAIKASSPVASADLSVATSPVEKSKSSRQIQPEKELLSVPPSGPSLGDFVFWKGDQTNSVPAPAWSTDSGKITKPTSLRDIQKEQENKIPPVQHQIQIPSPQKVHSNRGTLGSGSTLQLSGTSPSKVASPIQISAPAAQARSKAEDELFWGPLDQSKREAKQSDFPSLANPSGRGSKGIPGKGTFGGTSSRLKSSGSKPAEYSLSSSPASTESSLKGRRNAITKHKEAMDFKDWCESESVRLMGTKDTSFLEFCSKQPTSEAKILMTENLGSFDPNHEFIEKFLNYKELLSSDVIEIAFQVRNDRTVTTGFGIGDVNTTDTTVAGDFDPDMTAGLDGPTKGGGKKKGRKGKKVSPSVLGFNVVSNRIMMGEIQTVED